MKNRRGKPSARDALEAVARQQGLSVDEVRSAIEEAIAAAHESSDPQARAFWSAVPRKGGIPTAEEVIAFIAAMGKNIE